MAAITPQRAFLPVVPKSFCATFTIAQMVIKKNGMLIPMNAMAVFKTGFNLSKVWQFLK